MTELQEGMVVHKAEMLEMDYLRSLGIERTLQTFQNILRSCSTRRLN